MNLEGTTSSSFGIGASTISSGEPSNPSVGDVRIGKDGSWEQFSGNGWFAVEQLGNVVQGVSGGITTAVSETTSLVIVLNGLDSPTVLTLPAGREGQSIAVKDTSGKAGRFHIAIGPFRIVSNGGAIELVFTNGHWAKVGKRDTTLSADNDKVKIDLDSLTVDQDYI